MSSQPIVQIEDVTRTYLQGEVEVNALNGLNLELLAGEFTVLSGPSGSGKTTALNLIGALDKPTSGQVLLEGKNLADLSRTELSHIRRDRIGFVFQAYNLIPVLTAFENAEFVMALQGIPEKKRRDTVMKILQEVGLAGMENRRPAQMSGGQQQRVAIARAIAAQPAIILADEPTANLDSVTALSLLDLMEKLNREHGVTFLFSTHDQKVMDRAKRIIHLRDGAVETDELKN